MAIEYQATWQAASPLDGRHVNMKTTGQFGNGMTLFKAFNDLPPAPMALKIPPVHESAAMVLTLVILDKYNRREEAKGKTLKHIKANGAGSNTKNSNTKTVRREG